MALGTVELVVFAVQAGVKLLQTGRKVYVEATIGGDVDVPLPPVFAGASSPIAQARNYAESLRDGEATARQRFKATFAAPLGASFDTNATKAADGQWRLVQAYFADISEGLVPTVHRGAAELASVALLKQWEKDRSPFPSAVQRVAGTLVEVAIDYFVNVPGSLSTDSKRGQALHQFLSGLDDVQFADARWDSIVIALFTTALDTLEEHPEALTGGGDEQSLVRKIVAGVAKDVGDKLAADEIGDLDAEARIQRFGQVVLRSLLRNTGTAAVANPSILGIEDGAGQAMVQSVGSAFLGLLLGDDDEDSLGAGLRRVASTDGLDTLIQASLRAVVEHPDAFRTGNVTADKWLRGVLGDLYDRAGEGKPFFDPELFTAVATSAIDHGLRELPALLKPGSGGSAVLVDIARGVFDRLTQVAGGKPRWQSLQLSRSDVVDLFDGVFVSLAAHTAWFSRKGQLQNALKAATASIPLVIDVLGSLGDGSLKAMLRNGKLAGMLAAVLASDALSSVGGNDAQRAARVLGGLSAVMDAVWKAGANGADRLLDENVLLDLLSALIASDAIDELFGVDAAAIKAVVARLLPVLDDLRRGTVLTVAEMSKALAA